MLVSVVIPCFNESGTLVDCLNQVLSVSLPVDREVVIVDDGSDLATKDILKRIYDADVRVITHDENQGKGAAIRTALQAVKGDVVIIQDADLEYDPNDYLALLTPVISGEVDVVFGSRFLNKEMTQFKYRLNRWANIFLTSFFNLLHQTKITDMETCYKVMHRRVFSAITLTESRFGIEPEMAAAIAKLGVKIKEVPIHYHGRGANEGKKIGWKDGVRAVWCILRFR